MEFPKRLLWFALHPPEACFPLTSKLFSSSGIATCTFAQVTCARRAEVAVKMTAAFEMGKLDPCTRKIDSLFEYDIVYAATNRGRMTIPFWLFMEDMRTCNAAPTCVCVAQGRPCGQDLARRWPTNTQDVEGVNSVLKKIVNDAPSIAMALLSARTSIKRRAWVVVAVPSLWHCLA